MPDFSTSGILLRRVEHGDYDFILTFLTQHQGTLSVMAKYARKSVKRFSGVLEMFYDLDLVCNSGRGKLPILKEANLRQPFYEIRKNVQKTAYASYWAQLIYQWMEDGQKEPGIFKLLWDVLQALENSSCNQDVLSIFFQMKFLILSGLYPTFTQCIECGTSIHELKQCRIIFDLARGGLICQKCASHYQADLSLTLGTIKQLSWIGRKSIEMAQRIRFTKAGLEESLSLLEAFLPYHLGFRPRSLNFLKQIRNDKQT